ncbi:MAG: DEAD/DEAH box helicase [Burkholderiales bacterium]|nr:DEAD/DEAH box helicase [Burkholderiales bacterium]
MSFENLNLHPLLVKAIADSGYTESTPIQAAAIPELLAGSDVMASAQTGSGKTAAFILPALQRLIEPSVLKTRGPRILVLTPTRELALQVTAAADKYGKHMQRLRTVSILGGMPYPLQNKLLSQPIDILVATPGRLIDHIDRGRIDFSRLEMLVLDEADRMLDMGFIEDVERIALATPATRQTVLFSATLEGSIAKLARRLLKEPKLIQIAEPKARQEHIEQRVHHVDDLAHKKRLLNHLLRDTELNQAIVFIATKRDADTLADELYAQGHSASALHGDMGQRDRIRTLTRLRTGQLRVLVATDVAARGIDVLGITHVINYDLPKIAEDYVHRIGRTGRAGATGIAISFAGGKDTMQLRKIERFTGKSMTAHVVAGFEPSRTRHAPKVSYKSASANNNRDGNATANDAQRRGAPSGNRVFKDDPKPAARPYARDGVKTRSWSDGPERSSRSAAPGGRSNRPQAGRSPGSRRPSRFTS